MQKAEPQQAKIQNKPAAKKSGGVAVESPQTEEVAQLEAIIESSPQMARLGSMAAMMSAGPAMAAQRKIADMMHNSQRQQTAQKFAEGINGSPLMVAQRKRLGQIFDTAQAARDKNVGVSKLNHSVSGHIAGVAQRVSDSERDAKTTFGKNALLQAKKGDQDDPHTVDEGKFHLLKDESLGDAIVVPNVSGCAAVKVNVFSGVGLEQKLVRSIVFHSDALDESIEMAGEIGRGIVQLDMQNKSVSILMITNAKWKSMSEHSTKVLSVLTNILKKENIVFAENKKQLTYGIDDRVNIDMTGNDADILKRYEKNIPDDEQSELRGRLVTDYTNLLGRRSGAGRHQKKIRKGRGMSVNPDYIETPTRDDFILLDVKQRQSAITNLKRKLDAGSSSSWCFITTACVRSRGLEDDCEELMLLRNFRNTYLLGLEQGSDIIAQYYKIAPAIVASINKSPDAKEIYDSLYHVIRLCVEKIKQDRNEETFHIYKQMIMDLMRQYLPVDIIAATAL